MILSPFVLFEYNARERELFVKINLVSRDPWVGVLFLLIIKVVQHLIHFLGE